MKKVLKNILQYLGVVVISLLIAVALRLFVVDFYSIPSDSMEPAIEPGDFILVDKLSFGARMYRNFDFLEDKTEPETWRVKGFAPIRHGDVLVFNFPYSGGWNKISMHLSRFYVKRCIGVPGDTVQIPTRILRNQRETGAWQFERPGSHREVPGRVPARHFPHYPV